LEAQRAELVIGQLAFLPTLKLITMLSSTQFDKLAIEIGVLVHLIGVKCFGLCR
jgi:hypothetical protein